MRINGYMPAAQQSHSGPGKVKANSELTVKYRSHVTFMDGKVDMWGLFGTNTIKTTPKQVYDTINNSQSGDNIVHVEYSGAGSALVLSGELSEQELVALSVALKLVGRWPDSDLDDASDPSVIRKCLGQLQRDHNIPGGDSGNNFGLLTKKYLLQELNAVMVR